MPIPIIPSTIRTIQGNYAWIDSLSQAQHSQISRTYSVHNCTLATPVDARHHCPICLGVIFRPAETLCGHVFCSDCIVLALRNSPTCPLDRSPLPQPPGLPITVDFDLNYPNDSPFLRRVRELEAYMDCGALFKVKNPMKQLLSDIRIQCPFRKLEGCIAELPRCGWELRTHITEMRHGEGPSSNNNITQRHLMPLLPNSSPSMTVYCQELSSKGDNPDTPNAALTNTLKSKLTQWFSASGPQPTSPKRKKKNH